MATKKNGNGIGQLKENDLVLLDTKFQGKSIFSLLLGGRYLEVRQMIAEGKKRGFSHDEAINMKKIEYCFATVGKLQPIAPCSICGKRPARYFLAHEDRHGFLEPESLRMCCDHDGCKVKCRESKEGYTSGLRPLGFMATANKKSLYDLKSNFNKQVMDSEWVTEILRVAYELPDQLFSQDVSLEKKNRIALQYLLNNVKKQ